MNNQKDTSEPTNPVSGRCWDCARINEACSVMAALLRICAENVELEVAVHECGKYKAMRSDVNQTPEGE